MADIRIKCFSHRLDVARFNQRLGDVWPSYRAVPGDLQHPLKLDWFAESGELLDHPPGTSNA